MLRCEVSLNTDIQQVGGGPPRLILHVQADTGPTGFLLQGILVISGLDAWRADQIESELVKRLGGRACLCLGPKEMANILDGENVAVALERIRHLYDFSPKEIANRAGCDVKTIRAVLAGGRPYANTRRGLAAFLADLFASPSPGDTLRRCRVARGSTPRTRVASALDIPVEQYALWEEGSAEVPCEYREPLRAFLGLPPDVWSEDGELILGNRSSWRYTHAWPQGPACIELREAREHAFFSRKELARLVGCHVQSIKHWETGCHQVQNEEHQAALCRILALDRYLPVEYTAPAA